MSGGHFTSSPEYSLRDTAEELLKIINESNENELLKLNGAKEESEYYSLMHSKVSPEAFKNKDWDSIDYSLAEYQIKELIKQGKLVLYNENKILDSNVKESYIKLIKHLELVAEIIHEVDYFICGDSGPDLMIKLIKEKI